MRYLIDGYNLLFCLTPDVDPLRRSREEIIHELGNLINHYEIKATIVFDSHPDQALDFPSRTFFGDLEIIFSPYGQCADTYILEYLSQLQDPKIYTLVSSDRRLINHAKEIGAQSMQIPTFVQKIRKKIKPPPEKPTHVDPHIKELRKIFEERFKKLFGN